MVVVIVIVVIIVVSATVPISVVNIAALLLSWFQPSYCRLAVAYVFPAFMLVASYSYVVVLFDRKNIKDKDVSAGYG